MLFIMDISARILGEEHIMLSTSIGNINGGKDKYFSGLVRIKKHKSLRVKGLDNI